MQDTYIVQIKVTSKVKKKNNESGKSKDSTDNLNLPEIVLVGKGEWPDTWSETETITIKSDENGLSILVNKDNINLKRILKFKKLDEAEMKLTQEYFRIALGLIGFSIYSQLDDEEKEIILKKTTKPISQIIIPLIKGLSKLAEEVS